MIGASEFLLMHRSYDRMLLDPVGNQKKNRVPGKVVGCAKCGRTRCTLYGSGEKKLCKGCKQRGSKP